MLAIGLMGSFEDVEEGKGEPSTARRSMPLAVPQIKLMTVWHGYKTTCNPVPTQKECTLLFPDYKQMASSALIRTLPRELLRIHVHIQSPLLKQGS